MEPRRYSSVDKIDETLNAYRSPYGSWDPQLKRFKAIASKIPPRARDILNISKPGLISAELNIYDLLINEGIEPVQSATAAVGYPDTHQFLKLSSPGYIWYRKLKRPGDDPLTVLLRVAESDDARTRLQSVPREEYTRRLEAFRITIAEQLNA